VAAEELPGGFAAYAPVLRAMEEAGKIRRGHFVDGFTGAQYAHGGAVDRLRAARDLEPDVRVLAAVDPANPWGALLPWPDLPEGARPRRVAGAHVVLVGGRPVFFVDRAGDKLAYFPGADGVERGVEGLRHLAGRRRHRELRLAFVNGVPALRSEHADALEKAGLRVEPGGLLVKAGD
jgi:ATP-dependent Lhr-like helicase